MGAEELNSGLRASTANTLPTEPSPPSFPLPLESCCLAQAVFKLTILLPQPQDLEEQHVPAERAVMTMFRPMQ